MTTNGNGHTGVAGDLRALRRTAGLSQQQLAQKAECSLAAVALFESGYQPAYSRVLPRIITTLAEALDADTENEEGAAPVNATPSETSPGTGRRDEAYSR